MPQVIDWYLENRIIYNRYSGVVTIDDIRAGNAAAVELIRQGRPPVHDIVDGLEVDRAAFNIGMLNQAVSFFKESNLGWVIFVTDNPVISFLSAVASQVAHANFKIVKTREEAFDHLERVDSSLQYLRAKMQNENQSARSTTPT